MTGATLTFDGSGDAGHIATWSVTEEATPHSLADRSGGVGSLSVSAQAVDESVYLNDCAVTLTEDGNDWTGRVLDAKVQGAAVTLTAESSLRFLAATRVAPPAGTFFLAESLVDVGPCGGMAWDSAGNLFVSDTDSLCVRKYSESTPGVWSQVATTAFTTAGTGDGQFGASGPLGLACDPSGNVYATDVTNNRIQKFTNGLVYSAKQGSAGSGDTQYNSPGGIAYDTASGGLVVADFGNSRVKRIDTSLVYQAQVSTPDDPFTIASDLTGGWAWSSYIPSGYTYFRTSGGAVTSVPRESVSVAFDPQGHLWSIDGTAHLTSLQVPALTENEAYAPFLERQWGIVAIDSDGRLAAHDTATGIVQVFSGAGARATNTAPLSEVIESYVRLCDPDEIHAFDYDCASDPEVAFPGWTDNVWTKLKELCAVYRLEIYYQDGTVKVRDIGVRELDIENRTSPQFNPGSVMSARSVQIVNQNTVAGNGLTMYDAATTNTIHTVAARKRRTVTLVTTNHPLSLDQPEAVNAAPIAAGQYAVQDSTGASVSASAWTEAGGRLVVGLAPQTGSITLRITGPTDEIPGFTGPYSLANGSGSSRTATLSITGVGVTTNPQLVTIPTGADETRITRESGGTFDSPFVGDLGKAYDAGVGAATGFLFDATLTLWVPREDGHTFGDYVGRMFTYQNARWRVMSAKVDVAGVTITAKWHTTVGAVDNVWAGETVGDVDTDWAGYLLRDTNMTPLKVS